jgi:hypothetical protein
MKSGVKGQSILLLSLSLLSRSCSRPEYNTLHETHTLSTPYRTFTHTPLSLAFPYIIFFYSPFCPFAFYFVWIVYLVFTRPRTHTHTLDQESNSNLGVGVFARAFILFDSVVERLLRDRRLRLKPLVLCGLLWY